MGVGTILRDDIARIRMATSHPFETPVEGDVDVDEAVKADFGRDGGGRAGPLEGMGNAQVAEIYHRMKPEDQCLFRQFKRFHKHYYETQGHDAPSHQLTHGIVQQMFPGLPSADAETIAKGEGRNAGHRATQGAVQAAGTGGPNSAAGISTTTRGT